MGPFQSHKSGLRGAQGYLTKMSREFVDRWSALSQMASRLEPTEERLDVLQAQSSSLASSDSAPKFAPKSDSDYVVLLSASRQLRTRRHEKIVREAGGYLQRNGGKVSTLHPIDLSLHTPLDIIFEVKIVGERDPVFAIRDAVGQLQEYSYFLGRRDASLCVLLDEAPGEPLVAYVETRLRMLMAWFADGCLWCGPRTHERLRTVGAQLMV